MTVGFHPPYFQNLAPCHFSVSNLNVLTPKRKDLMTLHLWKNHTLQKFADYIFHCASTCWLKYSWKKWIYPIRILTLPSPSVCCGITSRNSDNCKTSNVQKTGSPISLQSVHIEHDGKLVPNQIFLLLWVTVIVKNKLHQNIYHQ